MMRGPFVLSAPLPEIQNDDAEARLQEVAAVAEKMKVALGVAMGTLFREDPRLSADIETVLSLLGKSPEQLEDWIYSTAFEGARQVCAGVRAHHPNMNLWPWCEPLLEVVIRNSFLVRSLRKPSTLQEFVPCKTLLRGRRSPIVLQIKFCTGDCNVLC